MTFSKLLEHLLLSTTVLSLTEVSWRSLMAKQIIATPATMKSTTIFEILLPILAPLALLLFTQILNLWFITLLLVRQRDLRSTHNSLPHHQQQHLKGLKFVKFVPTAAMSADIF